MCLNQESEWRAPAVALDESEQAWLTRNARLREAEAEALEVLDALDEAHAA